MEELKNFTPNLNFTNGFRKENIPFWDVNITLSNRESITDLHKKLKDHHQYLNCSSSHSEHTKRSIA